MILDSESPGDIAMACVVLGVAFLAGFIIGLPDHTEDRNIKREGVCEYLGGQVVKNTKGRIVCIKGDSVVSY